MMKYYRFYDESTGLFYPALLKATDPKDAQAGIPAGHHIIEGEYDHLAQRVDITKMNAERDAHRAAHGSRVEAMRANFAPTIPGQAFLEPPEPFFSPTSDCVVDYVPPQPSPDHEWNEITRRWTLSTNAHQRLEARTAALARIKALEREVQPGLLRAVALEQSGAKEKLQALDSEIAGLRTDADA